MTQYKCIRNCFYKNKLWKEGEFVEVPEGETVPHHFVNFNVEQEKVREDAEKREAEEQQEVTQLKQEIQSLGGDFDGRWGKVRLQQELHNLRMTAKSRGFGNED
ncbi:MAG: hypothetical protein GWN01_14315, partial [Nitrosopumilaceae archaeon]|nr:hypothetical protein [Nitrosopumilaceae archaeon]NIU88420.1 hypothetical protein [Nitrosopumilaceae archaeon]NIV65496.1 hypothetical protein [Nitrosopumilaceae archaeon]NIX62632.1 hypothetical protein [Nitrosopumilaceae archaeon]